VSPRRLNGRSDTRQRKLLGTALSVRACKETIDGGVELPFSESLRLELEAYDRVARSGDAEEGISAFLEKRKPNLRGK